MTKLIGKITTGLQLKGVINKGIQLRGTIRLAGTGAKGDTITYIAGDNIQIDGNVISALFPSVIENYVHVQGVASDVWVINHGMGKYPNFFVRDSGGNVVKGEPLYIDEDTLQITFLGIFSGTAELI